MLELCLLPQKAPSPCLALLLPLPQCPQPLSVPCQLPPAHYYLEAFILKSAQGLSDLFFLLSLSTGLGKPSSPHGTVDTHLAWFFSLKVRVLPPPPTPQTQDEDGASQPAHLIFLQQTLNKQQGQHAKIIIHHLRPSFK